jgi:hypothetical protein
MAKVEFAGACVEYVLVGSTSRFLSTYELVSWSLKNKTRIQTKMYAAMGLSKEDQKIYTLHIFRKELNAGSLLAKLASEGRS